MDMSVVDAAELLRVSPRRVRALIASGQVRARRIAGCHIVDSTSLRAARHVTRPMSGPNAWALIVGPERATWLNPSQKYRLRRRVAVVDQSPDRLAVVASWLAGRGRAEAYFCPDSARLLGDPRLVATGVSDPRSRISSEHDQYWVQPGYLADVTRDHLLVPSRDGQVRMGEAPVEVPTPAPALLVAVDLFEDGQPRSMLAAERLIRDLVLWP